MWHKLYKARFLQVSQGMNAIEVACWDILGKSLDVPVWKLLGGKQRQTLRVYANGWYQGLREPGFFAERAVTMVEKGYTALKFAPLRISPSSDRRRQRTPHLQDHRRRPRHRRS